MIFQTIQGGMRFRATREFLFCDGITLRLFSKFNVNAKATPNNDFAIALPVEFKTLTEEERGMEVPPWLTLPVHVAQELMDELWHCGLRPTEGTGSAGSLAATQRHLEDMKTVAFHALKIGTPGKEPGR